MFFSRIYFVVSFFFFQAEDGIRDVAVTGVQTCALPICTEFDSLYNFYVPGMNLRSTDLQAFIGLRAIDKLEIGRASCRERV